MYAILSHNIRSFTVIYNIVHYNSNNERWWRKDDVVKKKADEGKKNNMKRCIAGMK